MFFFFADTAFLLCWADLSVELCFTFILHQVLHTYLVLWKAVYSFRVTALSALECDLTLRLWDTLELLQIPIAYCCTTTKTQYTAPIMQCNLSINAKISWIMGDIIINSYTLLLYKHGDIIQVYHHAMQIIYRVILLYSNSDQGYSCNQFGGEKSGEIKSHK